jgi:hypothetical protein
MIALRFARSLSSLTRADLRPLFFDEELWLLIVDLFNVTSHTSTDSLAHSNGHRVPDEATNFAELRPLALLQEPIALRESLKECGLP